MNRKIDVKVSFNTDDMADMEYELLKERLADMLEGIVEELVVENRYYKTNSAINVIPETPLTFQVTVESE
jgi:hypothetical protein